MLYLSQTFYSYNEAKIYLRRCLYRNVFKMLPDVLKSEVYFLFRNDVFIGYEYTRMDLNFLLAVNKQEMQSMWSERQ